MMRGVQYSCAQQKREISLCLKQLCFVECIDCFEFENTSFG